MVWGCMGWNGVGKLIEVQGIMDAQQYCDILDDGLVESYEKLEMAEGRGYFSKTMTPNTPPKGQHNGLKTMTFKSFPGLPNPLTSTLLSTSGCI